MWYEKGLIKNGCAKCQEEGIRNNDQEKKKKKGVKVVSVVESPI